MDNETPQVWCPTCRSWVENVPGRLHHCTVPLPKSKTPWLAVLGVSFIILAVVALAVFRPWSTGQATSGDWAQGFTKAFGTVEGSRVAVTESTVGEHRVAVVYGVFKPGTVDEAIKDAVASWPSPSSVFETSEVDVLVVILRVEGAAEVTFSFTRAGELGVPTPEAKPSIRTPNIGGGVGG